MSEASPDSNEYLLMKLLCRAGTGWPGQLDWSQSRVDVDYNLTGSSQQYREYYILFFANLV